MAERATEPLRMRRSMAEIERDFERDMELERQRREQIASHAETRSRARQISRAETTGRVMEIPVEEGALVHKGDLIAVLDGSDRAARLAEAKALLLQRKAESEASKRLAEKGFAPKLNLAELAANQALAQAQVKSMEVEIAHLSIEAPIEGVLDTRNAEVGNYLQTADPVATIIDLDPIVLVGFATERDVSQLEIGGPARARLLDGREVVGALRLIAARAETETRTFRIEVEVPNADYDIRDGLSAELVVPVEDVPAHKISPAVLTLGPNGDGREGRQSGQ